MTPHCSTWKESNIAGTFQLISSQSLTRANENGSGSIEIMALAIVDELEFRWVWDRRYPIIQNNINKCSEHHPKIGPLTDLHIQLHSSYFSSTKRSSYKNTNIIDLWLRIYESHIFELRIKTWMKVILAVICTT